MLRVDCPKPTMSTASIAKRSSSSGHQGREGGGVAGEAVDQQDRRAAAALDEVDPLAADVQEAAAGIGQGASYSHPRRRK